MFKMRDSSELSAEAVCSLHHQGLALVTDLQGDVFYLLHVAVHRRHSTGLEERGDDERHSDGSFQ